MASLQELRKERFLSQEDLAKKSEMTTGTINRIENGKQKPRFATIRKLARGLDISPKDIDFSG